MFAKHFFKNSNLKNSGIPLPLFPCRTNVKLHNISVTLKMVKKVILNLDSSKVSASDCIPVVVLKNRWLEFSYKLAKLFSMCLMESYFPDCWKVTLVVAIFQNLGQGLQLKTTALSVFFLWFIKSFKNLQIIGLLINWRNVAFFLISSMILGLHAQSTADLWQLYLIKLLWSGATWAVAFDKAFNRV